MSASSSSADGVGLALDHRDVAQRRHRADADLLAREHDREHLRGRRDPFRQEALRAG
jgi:hypothetical protein